MCVYLAACKLCQVGLQVLANHRVDGHETEHASLANAALGVVIALRGRKAASGTVHAPPSTSVHTREGSTGRWEEPLGQQSACKHFQGQIKQIISTVQICTLTK